MHSTTALTTRIPCKIRVSLVTESGDILPKKHEPCAQPVVQHPHRLHRRPGGMLNSSIPCRCTCHVSRQVARMLFCSFDFKSSSPLARKLNVSSACLSFWNAASRVPWDHNTCTLHHFPHLPAAKPCLDDSKICHASVDFIVRQDAVLHFNKVVLAPYILSYKFRTVFSTAIQERPS